MSYRSKLAAQGSSLAAPAACSLPHLPPWVSASAVDDNVLARPADPVLIGFCVSEGYDAAAKVIEPDDVPAVYAAASTSGAGAADAGAWRLPHCVGCGQRRAYTP